MKLSPRQIQRLQKLRRNAQGDVLSLDQFRLAIEAKFSIETLRNALRGGNLHPTTYHYLVAILQKHAPEIVETDGKSAGAGEPPEAAASDDEDTTTHRGSR